MLRWILLSFWVLVAISNCDSNNTLAGVPCLGALNEQDRNWWEETLLQKKNRTGAAPLECGALALALQGGGAGGSGSLSPWTRFQESGNYRGFPEVFYRNNAIYFGGLGNGSFEDANEPSANKSIIAGRYDLAGNLVWRKEILTKQGAGVNVLYRSVTLDSESSIILLFQFQDNVANAVDGLAQVGGNQNLFIVKFNSNGDKVWSKRIGSTTGGQGIQGYSVAPDSNNEVIVAGDVGYGLNGETFVTGRSTGYVMRLDKNTGDPKNTRLIYADNNSSNVQAYAIAVDSSNNVYVSGRFSSTTTNVLFDAGEAGSGVTTSNKNSHFLMKLNSSLANRQWAIEVQSDTSEPNQLVYDGTDLFMAFPNATTSGSYPRVGTRDIGISKVSASNGTIAFTKTIGYSGVDFQSVPNVVINQNTNNLRFVGGTNTAFGDATVTGTFDAYILDVNKEGVEARKEFIGTAGASTFFTRVAFTPSGQTIFSGSSNRPFQGEPKTSEESAGFITTALQR